MSKTDKSISEMTYEQAYDELITIVEAMESRQQTLDEAMKMFERGQELNKHCTALLDRADLRIKELTEKSSPAAKEE